MLMFDRIAEQLRQIEHELNSIRLSMSGDSPRAQANSKVDHQSVRHHIEERLDQAVLELQESTSKLTLINESYSQLHEERPLDSVIELAMDLVWQKAPVGYAALILGDAELGPYHYYGMRGVHDSWRYIQKECAFTLSGVLARTLLQRLDPSEPDYLYIPDIQAYGRPLPDEFPWMSCQGSLLIIPLRSENLARGALLLGHAQTHRFDEVLLRDEYVDIASSISIAIRNAQMRQEMAKNIEQLINVQLLTREITHAQRYQDVTDILTKKIPEVIGKVDVQVFMQYPIQTEHRSKLFEDMPKYSEHMETRLHPHSQAEESSIDFSKNNPFSPTFPLGELHNMHVTPKSTIEPSSTIAPEIRQLFLWTMEAAEPVFYDREHLAENPEHPYCSDSGRALIVPIIGHSCTYGVIHITSLSPLRRFEESDMVVLRTIANSAATAIGRVELIQTREQAEVDALYELICAVEESSQEEPCHSQRVVHNAVLLAQRLGLSTTECRLVGWGAALHHISALTPKGREHQKGHPSSELQICPTIDPQIRQTLRVNPAVVKMLALFHTPYADHQQEFVKSTIAKNGTNNHRRYPQTRLSTNYSQERSATAGTQQELTPSPSAHEISFSLTHFDISQLGACVIHLVDAIDHMYAITVLQKQCDPSAVAKYINVHTGTRFDPTMAELANDLLGRNLFLLPTGAHQAHPSVTAADRVR